MLAMFIIEGTFPCAFELIRWGRANLLSLIAAFRLMSIVSSQSSIGDDVREPKPAETKVGVRKVPNKRFNGLDELYIPLLTTISNDPNSFTHVSTACSSSCLSARSKAANFNLASGTDSKICCWTFSSF